MNGFRKPKYTVKAGLIRSGSTNGSGSSFAVPLQKIWSMRTRKIGKKKMQKWNAGRARWLLQRKSMRKAWIEPRDHSMFAIWSKIRWLWSLFWSAWCHKNKRESLCASKGDLWSLNRFLARQIARTTSWSSKSTTTSSKMTSCTLITASTAWKTLISLSFSEASSIGMLSLEARSVEAWVKMSIQALAKGKSRRCDASRLS